MQDLVELASRGDRDAFAALASASVDRLFAVARRILQDHDQAQAGVTNGWDATLALATGAEPYVDPCAGTQLQTVDVGPSVDDLVTALSRIDVDVSPVADVIVDGYPGEQLTFTAPEPRSGCEDGEFDLWLWPKEFGYPAPLPQGGETRATVVDVDGTRVLIAIEDWGSADDSAVLQHMFDSLQLAPVTP